MLTLIDVMILLLVVRAYRLKGRAHIVQPDPDKATPARMYMDGVDFTPANRNVLFGYQFKSIAALGPIVGPIVAVRYGWLPALLWIVLGTSFIGWVQDYASIVVGVREEGQTFGALSYRFISPRARGILLIFIYCYLLLIMGAFGKIVGYDLMTNPAVPLGVILVTALMSSGPLLAQTVVEMGLHLTFQSSSVTETNLRLATAARVDWVGLQALDGEIRTLLQSALGEHLDGVVWSAQSPWMFPWLCLRTKPSMG